jgi:hypothetical protein
MIRVGSQLTFCSPEKILRRTAVEVDEHNVVRSIYSLDDGNVETSQTLFFDGILSREILSIKQQISKEETFSLLQNYQYLDLSENISISEIAPTFKPLIIDFGTNLPSEINNLIPLLASVFTELSIFDIIAACTYYPNIILGRTAELTENCIAQLVLWENTNLIENKLTFNTSVRGIN